MKKVFSAVIILVLLGFINSAVFAAELLDVKPIVVGSTVSVEISADIPLTYTYYKVPGQARAVIDIAEADPEKVEPLIVVNKGAVSSISVDKAQISGMVVSRIIFNLVSESDIAVTAAPDRKLLTVTFGGSPAVGKPEPKPEIKSEPKPEPLPEPVAKVESPVNTTVIPPVGAGQEEDPLGLDEPAAKAVAAPAAKTAAAIATTTVTAAAAVGTVALSATPSAARTPKLEPVVPEVVIAVRPSALTIQEITTGTSSVEIRANQPIVDYKATRISGPERLIIDIPGTKINQKPKSIPINKFGISKARIGVSPKNIRIVIDSATAGFPAYSITTSENGLRVSFK